MPERSGEVISLRVPSSIAKTLRTIPNRSEFMRHAIEAALDSACPLCGGSGVLSPKRKEHLQNFMQHHTIQECADCHEPYFECKKTETDSYTTGR